MDMREEGQSSGETAAAEDDATGASSARRSTPPADRRSSANTAGASWSKAKAAIQAEVREQHATQAAAAEDARLESWLQEAGVQADAADREFQAARAAFQQADSERAAARDAYRADAKNSAKSALWHASVQSTAAAQEAMRAAREALARSQALLELLQREAAGRGLQAPPAAAAAATAAAAAPGPAAAGSKRKRRQAPLESCPYCTHTYTVRDGLSSKADAEGNRLHLRRCQCREKTPPCKNCPSCKAQAELMAVMDAEEQLRRCRETYRCAICACKCPGAGKWIEGDDDSRRAFSERTEQRFGALSALGWAGGASAPSTATAAAAGAASGGEGAGAGAGGRTASWAAGPSPCATAAGAAEAAAVAGVAAGGRASSRAGSRVPVRSLKRLPADIRSELEQAQQAQQEQSTVDVLRGLEQDKRRQAQLSEGGGGGGGGGGTSAGGFGDAWELPRPAAGQAQPLHSVQSVHFHTCSHPHDECTSDCCSAPHAPGQGHYHHHHSQDGHRHHHHHHRQSSGQMGTGSQLGSLAAMAVAAQQAQHATAPGAGVLLNAAGLPGDLVSAAALQLVQRMMGAAGGAAPPPAGGLFEAAAASQPVPPPELPAEVTALVDDVFLHAAGPPGVQAVCGFLQQQRVTSLSDLEYMELSWLCKALEGTAGLSALLLNKFLTLGRRQAAAVAVGVPGDMAGQQQQRQQEPQQQKQ